MNRKIASLFILLGAALFTGCVDRRFVIETALPGVPQDGQAQVFRNGQLVSFSPADDAFVYYGKYDFTLIKDGYETLHVRENVRAPWYEIPPFDFIAENIVPWKIRDVRRLRYEMKPLQTTHPEDVLQHATPLREEARGLGVALPTPHPVPPPQ